MTRARLTVLCAAGALSLATAATPATAATLEQSGGTLVYNAAPGELNSVIVNGYTGNRLRVNDDSADLTSIPGACERIDGRSVACPMPSALTVELGDGVDHFSTFTGVPSIPIVVRGGDGDDELIGHTSPLGETFEGGPGNDIVRGVAGDDTLRGGPGNDIVHGDAGNDSRHGDDGDDLLKPDNGETPGNDVVDGGPGFDEVDDWIESAARVYRPVSITLDAGADDGRPGETDDVRGVERSTMKVSGRFVLSEGPDDWHFMSNTDGGPSTILAGGGNDRIVGEDHEETIDGGAGDDVLEGGKRADTITGGPGRDSIFGDETDTGCTWAPEYCLVFGNDTIQARDGERDDINCGPGTDKAVVDAIDVHAGCEEVDTGEVKPGGPGDPNQPPVDPPADQRVSLVITKLRLGAALRRGIAVRAENVKTKQVKFVLRSGGRVVAKATGKADAAYVASARLRFTKAAKRTLAKRRTVKLKLEAAGASRTLTLRR